MVSEQIIEKVIANFAEDEQLYINALSDIMEDQPALLAFLSQESNDVLTENEKDILWYITLIIISSALENEYEFGELPDHSLSQKEETNWEILQEQAKGTFRDRITPFFEEFSEEDLLAFVEDSLEVDDDSPITAVGREVIFISAKSIIDSIISFQA